MIATYRSGPATYFAGLAASSLTHTRGAERDQVAEHITTKAVAGLSA